MLQKKWKQPSLVDLTLIFLTITQKLKNRCKRDWHEYDASYGHSKICYVNFATEKLHKGVGVWGGR